MKTILILLTGGIYIWLFSTNAVEGRLIPNETSLKKDSINFQTQVQPIFQKNCSPCHFPGGKLYEKLPFDKGITIIDHQSGILKRIKNEEEINLIRQYTAQNKVAK